MAADYPDIDIAPLIRSHAANQRQPQSKLAVCNDADRFQFAAVCVYPAYVWQAAELLRGKIPKSVQIGFHWC